MTYAAAARTGLAVLAVVLSGSSALAQQPAPGVCGESRDLASDSVVDYLARESVAKLLSSEISQAARDTLGIETVSMQLVEELDESRAAAAVCAAMLGVMREKYDRGEDGPDPWSAVFFEAGPYYVGVLLRQSRINDRPVRGSGRFGGTGGWIPVFLFTRDLTLIGSFAT